jgi:hypothetical protein
MNANNDAGTFSQERLMLFEELIIVSIFLCVVISGYGKVKAFPNYMQKQFDKTSKYCDRNYYYLIRPPYRLTKKHSQLIAL